MGEIDDLWSELEKLSPLCDEAQEITQRINNSIERILSRVTRSGFLEQGISVAKQKLWALGGGLAIVVPMVIMVLHPTWIVNLITTICFVVVVAVDLAVSMTSSDPEDIVAGTAVYVAVWVVFVDTIGMSKTFMSQGKARESRAAGKIDGRQYVLLLEKYG